jgi:putative acetyltransferase
MDVSLSVVTTPTEWQVFKALLEEYMRTDHADPASSTIGSDIANIPGRYAPPQGGAVMAHVDGVLAGCTAFAPTAVNGTAEMKRVYVRAQFRRKGLARALAEAVMRDARSAGYTRVAISTWDHNASAIALYAQLGFATCTPFKQHPMQNLVYMDHVFASAQLQ